MPGDKPLVRNKGGIDYRRIFELTTKNGMPVDMAINSEFIISDRNKLINENYKQLKPRIEEIISAWKDYIESVIGEGYYVSCDNIASQVIVKRINVDETSMTNRLNIFCEISQDLGKITISFEMSKKLGFSVWTHIGKFPLALVEHKKQEVIEQIYAHYSTMCEFEKNSKSKFEQIFQES